MATRAEAARVNGKRGGRPKGSINKHTADVRALASKYGPEAIRTLASIMQRGESEQAKVAAANSLLDRWAGKPAQAITGPDGGALQLMSRVIHEHLLAQPRVEVEEIEGDTVKELPAADEPADG